MRKIPIDFIVQEASTLMLRNMPKKINRLISKEQSRIDLDEEQKLKKHAVVFRIVEEWYNQKVIIHQMTKHIQELEQKLHEANT